VDFLIGKRNGVSVWRPVRVLFASVRSFCQIDGFAAIAWYGVKIIEFVSGLVLLVYNPLSVRRPNRTGLQVVGLRELDGPSARCPHLPQIKATRNVAAKQHLLPDCASRKERAAGGTWRQITSRNQPTEATKQKNV